MPQLKDMLSQQVSLPLSIEAALPAGAPSLSGVMANIANAVPQTPDLPVPAGMGAGFQLPTGLGAITGAGGIPQVIKGIEETFPAGVPKLTALGGGFRGVEAPPEQAAGVKTTRVTRMGGGYRSISTR